MRVLYVLERFPELSQTFVSAEIRGLIEQGVTVDVAALQRGTDGETPVHALLADETPARSRLANSIIAASRSPRAAFTQVFTEKSWPPPHGKARLRGYARIAPWVPLARRADHIHAHFATEAADIGRLLSRNSGTPWSFTAHATDAYSDSARLALNMKEARFARAVAPHIHMRLDDAAPQFAAKVIEVPVAINDDRFVQSTPYEADGPIVAVGRLVEKKGFDDLIDAAALAADALHGRQILIIGDGPQREDLEARIASKAAPVKLLGAVSNTDIPRLLAGASVFAAPSKLALDGDRDGRPAAIAEAMCMGLPILSTTLPGIPGLVDSGHGILVEPANPAKLAAGLTDLLSRPPEVRAAMGRAACAHAREMHGHSQVARRMLDLFAGKHC